ncbi:unnamed protein product [Cunninghamella echinulata]
MEIYPQIKTSLQQSSFASVLFMGFGVVSFICTWTYMFAFFKYSYLSWKTFYGVEEDFSIYTMSQWLHSVSLFDDAWRTVCSGDWQWLWSIQLCTFTVSVWTPILAIEGSRRKIPFVWAYMLAGQVVAISVFLSLFFGAMLIYSQKSSRLPSNTLIGLLGFASFGGLVSTAYIPYVADSASFLPTLLSVHVFTLIPLFYMCFFTPQNISSSVKETADNQDNSSNGSPRISIIALYGIGSLVNLILIGQQWYQAVFNLIATTPLVTPYVIFIQLIQIFFNHPAQSSISFDVVCVYIISITWMMIDSKTKQQNTCKFWSTILIILTPLLSPAVTLPLYFAMDEYIQPVMGHKNK